MGKPLAPLYQTNKQKKIVQLYASLKCLYSNAQSQEKEQKELQVCIHLQVNDLFGTIKAG